MKIINRISFVLLLIITAIFHLQCNKEFSCENCNSNKSPVANAGPDQIIYFPTDSIILNGTNSIDPDGFITNWNWSKISGPANSSILNSDLALTKVKNLDTGTYHFELIVTDNGGLQARDTLVVKVLKTNSPNRPPVADAGPDQVISQPTITAILDGSLSSDPDNNIRDYAWRSISGSNSNIIGSPTNVTTIVTFLQSGIYEFELKVTDTENLSSTDTVKVSATIDNCNGTNRPVVNAQLTQIGSLSQARMDLAVTTDGNKIFYAGGRTNQNQIWTNYSTVDIYNTSTNTWSVASLSEARFFIGAIAVNNKVFFAGGLKYASGNQHIYSSTVDIYDINTNTWSVESLSIPRAKVAVATIGNKVIFAGGEPGDNAYSDRVDIYDLSTQSWSTASLSEPRDDISAVTSNNKVYFAGGSSYSTYGVSNRIDIYDNSTNSWSQSILQEARMGISSIAIGNKIYWAGGVNWDLGTFTCTVEIFDITNGTSTFSNLHKETWFYYNAGQQAVINNSNKIGFCGTPWAYDKFDIYDLNSNTWSIGKLPSSFQNCCFIKANNKIYMAGGYDVSAGGLSNKVWSLNF
jgi:hypothetical protein